jgi:hypothetical protein
MKVGIMQPYFFPYIGYFQLINAVDEFIIYDKVNYIKKGWVNRNNILINKKPYLINTPLKKKSSYKKIYEIQIKEDFSWKKKLLLDIYMSYKKAKCFNEVYPIIEKIINTQTNKLSELNYLCIKIICDYLGIKTKISISDNTYDYLEFKLNKQILEETFPNIKLNNWEQKVVRIVEICKLKKANVYINSIGGESLYSKEEFLLNGIELKFINTNKILYQQFGEKFVPNLSIIDVLMFNSIEEVGQLLNQYKLI